MITTMYRRAAIFTDPCSIFISWNRACYFRISNTSKQLIVGVPWQQKEAIHHLHHVGASGVQRAKRKSLQFGVKGLLKKMAGGIFLALQIDKIASLLCLWYCEPCIVAGTGLRTTVFPELSFPHLWYEHSFLVIWESISANALTMGVFLVQRNPAISAVGCSNSHSFLAQLQLLTT